LILLLGSFFSLVTVFLVVMSFSGVTLVTWIFSPTTGLSSSSGSPSNTSDTSFRLEDITLWNVLGYAVDLDDYINLRLVCREWNRILTIWEPPFITRMSHLLVDVTEDSNPTLTEEHLGLLEKAYYSLKNKDSPLYRKDRVSEKESVNNSMEWPALQPQFHIILMRSAFALLITQRGRQMARQLYEMSTTFLNSLTQDVVQKIQDLVLSGMLGNANERKDSFVILRLLLEQWHRWEGLVGTIAGVTSCLHHYYNNLQRIEQSAETRMASCLFEALASTVGSGKRPRDDDYRHKFPSFVLELMQHLRKLCETTNELTIYQHHLLVDAIRVGQRISNLTTTDDGNEGERSDNVVLDSIVRDFHELQAQLEQTFVREDDRKPPARPERPPSSSEPEPVTIISSDRRSFHFSPSSSFLTSSGLLNRLRLRAGDTIKLSCSSDLIEITTAFYRLHEREPFPGVSTPLPGGSLQEVVGESFAAFADSHFDRQRLFRVKSFADLMQYGEMVDLASLKLSFDFRGLRAAEIRQYLADSS